MENYTTYVIVAPLEVGRGVLEDNQNSKFDSQDEVIQLISEGYGKKVREKVLIFNLDSFMDYWNYMTSDLPKKERFKITDTWFGYVQIKNEPRC